MPNTYSVPSVFTHQDRTASGQKPESVRRMMRVSGQWKRSRRAKASRSRTISSGGCE